MEHSKELLDQLTQQLLSNEKIPLFFYHCIQEDLETLQEFYQYGPACNRRLRLHHDMADRLIAQDRLDDLIVTYNCRRQKKRTGRKPENSE